MKRTLSHCFFGLLFFFPAIAWAQDTQLKGGKSDQVSPPQLRGAEGQAPAAQPQIQNAISPDTSAVLDFKAEASKEAPMFPDSLMKNYEIEVFQGVLKMADLVGFKYNDAVAKAKNGDIEAIRQLLDFHRIVDGRDALNHAVTCLEILPLSGDMPFAAAVSMCNPKLNKVVLDRLVLAQGRTKKKFLLQSLAGWAPISWAYLNGEMPPEKNTAPPSTEGTPENKKQ